MVRQKITYDKNSYRIKTLKEYDNNILILKITYVNENYYIEKKINMPKRYMVKEGDVWSRYVKEMCYIATSNSRKLIKKEVMNKLHYQSN